MAETGQQRLLRWWSLTRGDIDATVAQVGFNVAQAIIPAFLLLPVGISMGFSVGHLLPGYALGFVGGSFALTALGVGLAKREGRADVTAHVYINNVPGIIAYTLAIMLPVYLQTRDQELAWRIGAAAVVWTGVIKLVAAPFAGAIRKFIPKPATMTVFGAAMYTYLAMVLLQRIFDQPLVGIVALTIIAVAGLASVPITKWRIPPFLLAWLLPLAIGLSIGYIHPAWQGISVQLPFVRTPDLLQAMGLAIPYLSVIAPMSIYQVLQDIASVEGGNAVGDNYDVRFVVAADGLGTFVCGAAGSIITPVIAALHPPYKAMGARIGFCFWTAILYLAVTMSGLTLFIAQLFPWAILAAMIAYVAIGVGRATLHRVEQKYWNAMLLGLVLPTGAVVGSAVNSALPALKLSIQNPEVAAALNRSIYWSSLQGLGNGFLFLVLVVSAMITEMIDRNFGRAAIWCLIAAAFSWLGLMHSPVMRWGAQPMYAAGWLAAAFIVFSARWWRGDVARSS
jgi:AGZA family xanthine/uracil permease-like MFS transporter